jgi:hypothetical protein
MANQRHPITSPVTEQPPAGALDDVADVVKAFGGTKALAAFAGVGMSAVSKWIHQGWIPPGWHWRFDVEARRRGFAIDPVVYRGAPVAALPAD